ncbi:SDR family NAD(P)-dependent oxidoreductase [Azorhizobium doebereinerae]|uniref:SDR family NAD(P)-dependent oxidoreductase n=1 Tax=Azorhizobium doebereinerae TaxID=281091 RepID=UPI0003FC8ABF|nr:SDR family oxidoreductase [Azorhizobium doebereinerae]
MTTANGLEGKVALVTGASRGIGAAIARRLARDGADVAITYGTAAEAAAAVVRDIEALGRRALALKADSADPRALTEAVDAAATRLGRLDILVNNAGIFPTGPFEAVSLADIDLALALHARAAFVGAQAAARHFKDGGRIISIGSQLAERVPGPGVTLYAMSKAALLGFTRGLARDLGPRGITVNLVQPGSTDTDMNPADSARSDGQRARSALGRYSTPEEVAGAVAYFASPDAANITGTRLLVDGGASA